MHPKSTICKMTKAYRIQILSYQFVKIGYTQIKYGSVLSIWSNRGLSIKYKLIVIIKEVQSRRCQLYKEEIINEAIVKRNQFDPCIDPCSLMTP